MDPFIYTEHNYTAIIKKYIPTSAALKGMRARKPFLRNSQIMVNIDDKLYLVRDIEFKDTDGNYMFISDVNLDTDLRIAGIIIHNDEILLQHRIKDGKEYYVFPGGHKGIKETEIQTLKREMDEELGLDIDTSNVELFLELKQDGFGPEKFFLIKGVLDFSQLKNSNPDTREDEVCEPVFLKLTEVKNMDNILPKVIVEKL